MRAALVVAVLGGVAMSGCGVPDYVTTNTASVNVWFVDINGGATLSSDVLKEDSIEGDNVNVSLAVRDKNLGGLSPDYPNHVIFNRYQVRYLRSDGRNVEGVEVPYSISGSVTWEVDVAESGTGTFSLEVVRAQAKLEPPLINLRGLGGAMIITTFAEVTVYGRTLVGEAVSAQGTLQIDFADWAD